MAKKVRGAWLAQRSLPQRSNHCIQPHGHVQEAPLLKLQCACLFVTAESDPLCPLAALAEAQQRMQSTDVRNIMIQVRGMPFPTGKPCAFLKDSAGSFDSIARLMRIIFNWRS